MKAYRSTVVLMLLLNVTLAAVAHAGIGDRPNVGFARMDGGFPLTFQGKSAPLCASPTDHPGVLRVLKFFQADIGAVTGTAPEIVHSLNPGSEAIVLVGTLGRNPLIDSLVRAGKLDTKGVAGLWEASLLAVVEKPFPGVGRALVIAGSDKRGTIYGMLDLSEQIGVSPWYWWADVPVKAHKDIFVRPGRHAIGPPSVKYRGIFLNDEFPSLTNWVRAKYGEVPPGADPPRPEGVANYGHEFYERIFEVLLRLKANYLWPAMWNNAFNEDDPLNPELADEYGIVMGTSHQEPMLRAQKEWDRRFKKTLGSWNYARHPDTLERFWRDGIRRNRDFESVVTIGLRGADDTPMAPGGPEENMALLEKIIGVQRNILAEEMKKDVTEIPQVWCLYKEVLEFYKAGMRVPEDVTLLWPDDNWGNNRRLPTAEERKRQRRGRDLLSLRLPRRPAQLSVDQHQSHHEDLGTDVACQGVRRRQDLDRQRGAFQGVRDSPWSTSWRWHGTPTAGEATGSTSTRASGRSGSSGRVHAAGIAEIVSRYTKYNGRRKPELLSPTTYSLVNYHEAENVVADFKEITRRAEEISAALTPPERDALYGLVLFPTKASSLVNELYVAAGKHALYAKQGRSAANDMADETRALFTADTALMGHFNREFVGGKWDHFMDQPHLGYTSWRDPPENSLNAIPLQQIDLPGEAGLGVAVEGSEGVWPGVGWNAVLPDFDPFNAQRRMIEVFNRGRTPFRFSASADKPWIRLSARDGEVAQQARIWVTIDWKTRPRGETGGTVTVTGAGKSVAVNVVVSTLSQVVPDGRPGFFESDGVVSMEAGHHTRLTQHGSNRWVRIEDYGHTLSALRATSDVDAPAAVPGKDSPCLEYRMYLLHPGEVQVTGIFGATLNFLPGRDLRYAVSFDGAPPGIVTLVPKEFIAQHDNMDWEKTVADNARHSTTSHRIGNAGYHTLKIWMVDPGVVLQKIVVNTGGLRPSYLGPPESFRQAGR